MVAIGTVELEARSSYHPRSVMGDEGQPRKPFWPSIVSRYPIIAAPPELRNSPI